MHLPIVYSDLHWSETSSILRSQGNRYTTRLEKLIETVNGIERHAEKIKSDTIIVAGDIFDKAELTAQEITALQEVQFNKDIHHIFLVGNHEISKKSLQESSTHLFRLIPNCTVIDTPTTIDCGDAELCFLPYIVEVDRKPIGEYFSPKTKYRVIISHNDILGMEMGSFVSQSGFGIEDIENNCDLFLNGHLHNGCALTSKIITIGNVCGQNFSEDAFRWEHCYFVLDLEHQNFIPYRNPYAINFYTINHLSQLADVKQNAVVSVLTDDKDSAQKLIDANSNIIASRITITSTNPKLVNDCQEEDLRMNHLQAFSKYVVATLGDNKIVSEELQEILK